MRMIGRLRPKLFRARRVAALRWSLDAGVPFPEGGFQLSRISNGALTPIADLRLPGAVQAPNGTWAIDPGKLQADWDARRKPYDGAGRIPDLPTAASADALLPLLTFCLPEASDDACQAQFAAVAESFANAHAVDPELTARYWAFRPVPPIAALVAMRGSPTYDDRSLYAAVLRFYQAVSVAFVLQLANDFGTAKLIGLGFDDLLDDPVDPDIPDVHYEIVAAGDPDPIRARPHGLSEPCARAPKRIKHRQVSALLGYPGFKRFYREPRGWVPVLPTGTPQTLAELTRKAERGVRTYPGAAVRLCWLSPSWTGDGRRAALHFDAMRWRVERHRFGRATATDDDPPAPPKYWRPCRGAWAVQSKSLNSWVDDVAPPWGDLPFEGWHAYRIRAIDVFGIEGDATRPAFVRFQDEIGPPPPSVRREGHRVDIASDKLTQLDLVLDWGVAQELAAPDAAEFRLRQDWVAIAHTLVRVTAVSDAPSGLNALQADVQLAGDDGAALGEKTLEAFVGGTLMAQNGEFPVHAVVAPIKQGAPPYVRVGRAIHEAPAIGGAAIRYVPSRPAEAARPPAIEPRRGSTAARATLLALEPLTVSLAEATLDGDPLPDDHGSVHLAVIDSRLDAAPGANAGEFVLTLGDRPEDALAAGRLVALRGMGLTDAAALLKDSPALFLPPHAKTLDLAPPVGFVTGTLEVRASAADAVPYRGGGRLLGNEGPAVSAFFTAYALDPPGPVEIDWVPRTWARGAAEFVDTAEALVEWPAATGALWYEVERAIETALGLAEDADDEAILAEAERIGDRCFERRTNMCYGARWVDSLPGRMPYRAIYRVRPATAAGVLGEWASVMLVRVPDIRIPPLPNVVLAAAPAGTDRAIALCWMQPGPKAGIGFRIEARRIAAGLDPEEGWAEEASYLPGQLASDRNDAHSALLIDQPPGLTREFRVVAVRHALDPIDPRGKRRREIRGRPSLVHRASASGEMRAPVGLAVALVGDRVTLRWANLDAYEWIEIRRRRPDGYGFERVERIEGTARRYVEVDTLPAGTWTYELAAIAPSRRAVSERVAVELP